ncbi:hypothetical protein OROMI_006479 [Orobanche minor]
MSDYFSSSPTNSTSEELDPLFDDTLDTLCGRGIFFGSAPRQYPPESQAFDTVVPETEGIFDTIHDSPDLRVSDTELQDSDVGSSRRCRDGLFRKRMAPAPRSPVKIERKKVVFRGEKAVFRILQCFCPTVTWEVSLCIGLLHRPPLKLPTLELEMQELSHSISILNREVIERH